MLLRRILMLTFSLLLIWFSFYWLSNMMCRTSLQHCSVDTECAPGTVCVAYTADELRCSPTFCRSTNLSLPVTMQKLLATSLAAVAHWTASLASSATR